MAGAKCAAIFVSDTGTGIAADAIPRIFEPFFTTKAQGKGTGLGLSVVYSIVERSGGIIDIDTELGRGTTFTIYMPLATGAPEDVASARAFARGGKERIMVVAGEPALRNLAFAALTQQGFRCSKAADGAEAVAILARLREPPNLLLADIEFSGDLAAGFRERQPALKMISLAGQSDPARLSEALAAPVLRTPFSPDELVALVRAVLDGDTPD